MMLWMKSRTRAITLVLALTLAATPPLVAFAKSASQETLTLEGCLLLSRKAGVFALHMEYNRIAVMGHGDLNAHLGHMVKLSGTFEERGRELRFIVEDVTHVAPTCETRA